MSLLNPTQLNPHEVAHQVGWLHVKQAADTSLSYGLAGRLYVSKTGWGLLSVPNALVRGVFDALDEPGIELPPAGPEGRLNAHISVFRKDEIEAIGPDNLTERGHTFRYTLGPVKTCKPDGWDGMSKVWLIEVRSPELEKLRKSYGLTPLPKDNQHKFHITVGVRRTNVLRNNDVKKAAGFVCSKCKSADCDCLGGVTMVPVAS